jgi:hypothetical protein
VTLLVDTFWEQAATVLAAEGWFITDGSRYDPTILNGLTPTGKAFSVTLAGDTVTVTVAGRVRTLTRTRVEWEAGELTVAAIRDAYRLLPANQR